MAVSYMAAAAKIAIRTAIRITGVPVTITRGEQSASVAKAGRGKSVYQFVSTVDAFTEEDQRQDFLIWPNDYDLGDGPTQPQEGDQLQTDDGTTVHVWECNAPSPEPGFRYTDQFQTAWRIHAKLIETKPSES